MNKKFRTIVKLFFLSVTLFFTACASHPYITPPDEKQLYPPESYLPQEFYWQEVAPGISRFDYRNPQFPIIYHAIRIDLTQPGLELICFPDASTVLSKYGEIPQNIEQPFIYKGIKTLKFAQKYNCNIAMNASPFGGKNGAWDIIAKLGSTRQIVGIHKADGIIISQPVPRYAEICFKREQQEDGTISWVAKIESTQSAENISEWDYAFGDLL